MNKIYCLIPFLLFSHQSVKAANFEHCQPFDGVGVSLPFRFGPNGQTILQRRENNSPVLKAVEGFERITYSLPQVSTDPQTGHDTIRYEARTSYIQRRNNLPASLTTFVGQAGGPQHVHQEIFAYLPGDICEIRQRVSWRQNGGRVENVFVEDARLCPDLVQAVRAEFPEGLPSIYRPLRREPLDIRRCHSYISNLAEIVKRYDSRLENYRLITPEMGELTVRARIPGQLLNPSSRLNPGEPMFLPPMPIDPNSVLGLLAKVGTCRAIQGLTEFSGIESRTSDMDPPRVKALAAP